MSIESESSILVEQVPKIDEAYARVTRFLEERPLLLAGNRELYENGNLWKLLVGEVRELEEALGNSGVSGGKISLEMRDEAADVGFFLLTHYYFLDDEQSELDVVIAENTTRLDRATIRWMLYNLDMVLADYSLGDEILRITEGKNGEHLPQELFELSGGDLDGEGKITESGRARSGRIVGALGSLRDQMKPYVGERKLPAGWRVSLLKSRGLLFYRGYPVLQSHLPSEGKEQCLLFDPAQERYITVFLDQKQLEALGGRVIVPSDTI